MLIYLMRHGIATAAEPGGRDAERPLSQQGTLQTALAAKGLLRLGVRVDRVVASPLLRAQQTADIVARILELPEPVLTDPRLAPYGSFETISEVIQDHRDAQRLMLVSHQPAIGEGLSGLCGRGELSAAMGTGAVAAVVAEAFRPHVRGALEWLIPASMLEQFA
ncbi:MAG: phosphohistidine phosphatase SixA [Chlorobi bacterium]|nr:MAG: phosphohistidine phosphatase SixA [Chlorobi bacterium OLB7]MBK8910068.1 phosphohistidine phosphatase SixA [Chlorobiota bacterium]